jgi:aspartate ammonia-lyase
LQSLELLINGTYVLQKKCVDGIKVNEKRVKELFEKSFAYATAFNPYLGYKTVSKLVLEAYEKQMPLKQLILDKGLMEKEDIEKAISQSTGPSIPDKKIQDKIKQ